MKTKKWTALLLAAVLILGNLTACGTKKVPSASVQETTISQEAPAPSEEANTGSQYYAIGDKINDFTVTMADGQTFTLSKILETKEMVLLNFWATWCGPCKMEFPYMEEAYLQYQDKVEILALSVEPTDSNEVISQFKQELGLSALPMGADTTGLGNRFDTSAIPTSVVIDRFGVICWMEAGSITETEKFTRLFDGFLGDDYTESKVGYRIPGPKPTIQNPTSEMLNAALNIQGGSLEFTNDSDPYAWPFVPTGDGNVKSSNEGVLNTFASVLTTVAAKKGDVLAFDYTAASGVYGILTLSVNDTDVTGFICGRSGSYVHRFDSDGTFKVKFTYTADEYGASDIDYATLDQVRLLTGEEAEALASGISPYPKGQDNATVIPVNAEAAVLYLKENESEQLRNTLYISKDGSDTITYEIHLGKEQDPGFSLFAAGDTMLSLADAEYNGEAYFVTANILDEYPVAVLLPDIRNRVQLEKYVCRTADTATEFVASVWSSEVAWAYEKDMPNSELNEGPVQYKIRYVDQHGNSVAGVTTQVCTDEICNVLISDNQGVVAFEDEPYPYEVHVLKVPEGYQFDSKEVFTLNASGGELEITIPKK